MNQHLFNKESRRQAKLDAIIETASTLVSQRGVADTSLDEVAKVLGVTKPTLYHYVSSKEDLLIKCMERFIAKKEAIIEAARGQGKNGREKLELYIRNYAEFSWSDSSGMPGLMLTTEIGPKKRIEFNEVHMKLVHRTRAMIREGVEDGSLVVGQPELLENFIVGVILWTPIAFMQRRQELKTEATLDAYVGYLMNGISAKRTAKTAAKRAAGPKGKTRQTK